MKLKILIILFLALSLRLFGLNNQSFSVDEGISWLLSLGNLKEIILNLKNFYEVHPPLYFFLLHNWKNLAFFLTNLKISNSEFILRLSSVVCSFLSLYFTYLLARKKLSENLAFLVLVLMSFSAFEIILAQELRMYPLLSFLSVASLYYFLLFLENNKIKNRLFYLFFSILSIYTHYFSFFIILAENIYFLYNYKIHKKNFVLWIILQLIILISFLPWIKFFIFQTQAQDFSLRDAPNLFSSLNLIFNLTFSSMLTYYKINFIFLFFFPLGLLILGVFNFKYQKNFWIICFFLPLILVFLISQSNLKIFEYKYFIIILPAFFSLMALGLEKLNKKLASALIGFFIILNLFSLYLHHFNLEFQNQPWRSAAGLLNQNAKKDDLIIIHPSMFYAPLAYYYQGSSEVLSMDYRDKTKINKKYHNIWLVFPPNHPFCIKIKLKDYLLKSFALKQTFASIKKIPANNIEVDLFQFPKRELK
ncbi:MAG: glycosyltransferase family 39 protein [Armatimonadetes bacterium]|nr:glycosyltransferase family 39 protein [Armatimonadota bacterium]